MATDENKFIIIDNRFYKYYWHYRSVGGYHTEMKKASETDVPLAELFQGLFYLTSQGLYEICR